MVETNNIFSDRCAEIEFYFSILKDFDNIDSNIIKTSDNSRLFRIMKSNFILMIYNLIEATFSSGINEIYRHLENENCTYNNVITEIQNIWRDYKFKNLYKNKHKLNIHLKSIKNIIDIITSNKLITMNKNMNSFEGNLNAKIIKDICDKHKIRYITPVNDESLEYVRKKRNSLAHGEESFGNCSRDFSIKDLQEIKDTVIPFMQAILNGMTNYYREKQFLRIAG